jgi:hypothetical protein
MFSSVVRPATAGPELPFYFLKRKCRLEPATISRDILKTAAAPGSFGQLGEENYRPRTTRIDVEKQLGFRFVRADSCDSRANDCNL